MSNITNDAASGRRPPERKRETINVNGEWLTREQIAARIQEMMAAGNTGIRELAEAADELDARLMVMAKREMEGARKRLESNRDLFEDSSEVESLLSEAGGLGERKEYESSLDASHGANALIEGRREEHYTDMISSLIEDAEGILHESRDMGIDAKGTENLLGKARNLLHRREYEEALEIARSVGELIVGTRKKHLRGGAMELLGVVKGLLDEAAGLGMETEEWQGDFKEAEGLFGTEDYEKASNALSTLRSAISNGMETRNAEQLKAALAEYIELVDRARESGLGVDEELKAGGRIEDIIRTDGYREALHAVATMRKTLLARLSSQRRRNTTKLLRERTSELNDFQRAEGREFPELREILDRAFDALEEEDLGSAEEIFAEFMKTKRDWEDRLAIERLAEEAEIVETQITPLMEAGVDVSEASRLLSSLKESISEGDVAGGGERLDTLKEEVEKLRVTKVKKLAYGKMKSVKKLLLDVRNRGLDIKDQKEAMTEAIGAVEKGDYLTGFNISVSMESKLIQRLATAERNEVEMSLVSAEELMAKAAELWLDVGNVQSDLEEAREGFEAGDLERARELSASSEKALEDMLGEKQAEIYKWKAEEIGTLITEGEGLGLDMSGEKEERGRALGIGEEGKLAEAAGILKEMKPALMDRINNKRTDIHEKRFEEAEDELSALEKDAGRKYEDLDALLNSSSTALDEGNYDRLDTLLSEFREKFDAYEHSYRRESHGKELEAAEKMLGIVRTLGIDIRDAEDTAASARESLEGGELGKAGELLVGLRKVMEEIRNVRAKDRAKEVTKELNGLFKRLKAAGMDLETEEELFNQIVEAIKSKNFIRACTLSEKSMNILRKRDRRRHLSEVEVEVERAETLLSELKGVKRFSAVTLAELEEMVAEMKKLLLEEDPEGAAALTEEFGDMEARFLEERTQAEKADAAVRECGELSALAEELGIAIDEEKEIIAEAGELLSENKNGEAVPLLEEVRESLGSRIELHRRDRARKILSEAEDAVAGMEEAQDEGSELQMKLVKAGELLSEGAYEECHELSDRIIRMVEDQRTGREEGAIRGLLESSRKLMDETKAKGGDISRGEALFYKATYFLEKNDLDKARELAKTCLDNAMTARMSLDRNAATELVERMVELRGKGADEGYDTSGMDEIIDEAREFVEEGDMKEIAGLMAQVEREYSIARGSWYMEKARALLAEAGQLWLDTDQVSEDLDAAENTLREGDAEGAVNEANAASEILTDMISKAYRDKSEAMAKKLSILVKEAGGEGVDISDDKKRFNEIISLKKEGRFAELSGLISGLCTSVGGKICQARLLGARKTLVELEASAGCEFEDLGTLLDAAKMALDKRDHKEVRSTLERFDELHRGHSVEHSSSEYSRELGEMAADMEEYGSVGLDMEDGRKLLAAIGEAVEGKEMEAAGGLLVRLREYMNDTRKVRAKDRAWEREGTAAEHMEELIIRGVDVSEGKRVLRDARRALRQGDHVKGIRLSNEADAVFIGLTKDKEADELLAELDAAEDFLEILQASEHISEDSYAGLQALLDETGDAIEHGETARARELLLKYGEREKQLKVLMEGIDEAMKELDRLRELAGEAEERGVSTADMTGELERVVEMVSGGVLEAAHELMTQVRTDIEGSMAEHGRREADEQLAEVRALLEEHAEALTDPEEFTSRIGEIEDLMESEEYIGAAELAANVVQAINQGKEQTRKQQIDGSLRRLEEFVGDLEKVGADVSKAEALFYKAKYFLEKGDLDKAHTSVREGKDRANYARKDFDVRVAEGELRKFEKESGSEYADLAGILEEARRAMGGGDFGEVDGHMEEFHRSRTEHYHSYLTQKYNDEADAAEKEMSHLAELGLDVKEGKEALAALRDSVGGERFEEAAERAQALASQREGLRTVKAKSLAKKIIGETNTLFVELKRMDLDVSRESGMFKEVLRALKSRDYIGGLELTHEARAGLFAIRRTHFMGRADGLLKDLSGDLDEAEELGLDAARMDDAYDEAMDLYEEEKFEEAISVVEEARGAYADMRNAHFRDRADESMEKVRTLLREAEELEMGTEEFTSILERVDKERESGNFEDALDGSVELEGSLSVEIGKRLREIAAAKNTELSGLMARGEELGVDTVGVKEQLGEAKVLAEAGKIRELISLFTENIGSMSGGIAARLGEINAGKIGDARDELTGLEEETGGDYDDLSVLLETAEEELEAERYDELDAVLADFRAAREEHRLDFLSEKYTENADGIEKEMTELESLGIEVDDAYDLMAAVRKGVSERDFSLMEDHVSRLEEMLNEARTTKARELAKGHFVAAKELQAELKDADEPVEKEMAVFKSAVMAIKEKDFVQGLRLTRNAEELLTAARERWRQRLAEEAMGQVEEAAAEGEELGLTPALLEDLHSRIKGMARQAEEGDFLGSRKAAEEALELYEGKRNEHFKRRAEARMAAVRERIAEGYELELTMEDVEEPLGEAEALLAAGDYEEALERLTGTADTFTALREGHFRDAADELLGELEGELARGRELSLDFEPIVGEYDVARELYAADAYEDAIERAKGALLKFADILLDHYRESTDSMLETIKALLDEARDYEVDVSRTRDTITEIRELYGEERFEEAHGIGEIANTELRTAIAGKQLEALTGSMADVDDALREAAEIEADVSEERDGLTRIEDMRHDGRLKDAIDAADELLESIERKADERRVAIGEGKLEQAEETLVDLQAETGWELREIWEMLDGARDVLEAMEYDRLDELLSDFRDRLAMAKDRYLSEKMTARLDALAVEAEELSELGLSASELRGYLEAAREFCTDENWDEAGEAAGRAESALAELKSRDAKDLAKKLFVEAKKTLGELKEVLEDTEGFETAFKEAVNAIKGRDFTAACGKLKTANRGMLEARTSYFRNGCDESFGILQSLLPQAAGLEVDLESVRQAVSGAKELYDSGDFEAAAGAARECADQLGEGIRNARMHIIAGTKEELTALLREAGEIEADISDEMEGLRRAERDIEDGRLVEVIEHLDDIITSTADKIGKRRRQMGEAKLEDVKRSLRDLSEESGREYGDLSDLIVEAQVALDTADYPSLEGLAARFEEARKMHLNTHLADKYAAKADALEAELDLMEELGVEVDGGGELMARIRQMVKDGDFEGAKASLERLSALIDEGRNVKAKTLAKREFTSTNRLLMRLKKEGIDLSEEERTFREILGAIKARDFIKSIQLTKEVNEKLARARTNHTRKEATRAIESLEGMLGEATGMFKDTGFLERLHRTAMDNYDEEKFDDALELIGKAREEFDEKRKEFHREMAEGAMGKLEEMTGRCTQWNIDVTAFSVGLARARKLYENGQYEEAEETAGDTLEAAIKAFEDRQLAMIRERTDAITPLLNDAKTLSVDSGPERGKLLAAEELREEKRYEEIIELLSDAERTLGEKIEARRLEMSTEEAEKARGDLVKLQEETGERYVDLEELLKLTENAIMERDWDAAEGTLAQFVSSWHSHRNAHMREVYGKRADSLAERIKGLEEIGLEPGDTPSLMEHLRAVIEGNDFDAAEEAAGRLEAAVDEMQGRDARALAKKRFIEAKELMSEMKPTGADLRGGDTLFARAVKAIRDKDFVGGAGAAGKAVDILSDVRAGYQLEMARSGLAELDEMTGEAHPDLVEIIEAMDAALAERDHTTLIDQLAFYREARMEYVEEHRAEECLTGLREVELDISGLAELGIGIPGIEEALMELGEYVDSHDFTGFEDAMKDIGERLELARTETAKDVATGKIMKAKEIFGELSRAELDLSSEEAMFRDVMASIQANRYVEAVKGITDAIRSLTERRNTHRKNLVSGAMMEVENLLAGMSHLDINTTDVEEALEGARKAFEEGNYVEAGDAADRAKEAADAAKDGYRRRVTLEALKETDDLVRIGAEEGLTTGTMEEAIAGAFMLIEERRYDEAEESRARAESLLREARLAVDRELAHRTMAEARELLRKAESMGLDSVSVETQLEYANVHLEDGEFEAAQELVGQAVVILKEMIGETKRRELGDSLGELEPLLATAGELGADVAADVEALASIKALLAGGRFEEAAPLIATARESLSGKIEEGRWAEGTQRIASSRERLLGLSEESGVDTVEMEEMLMGAEEMLNAGDVPGFEEKMSDFESAHAALLKDISEKRCRQRGETLRVEAERIAAAGIDVTGARESLERARAAVESEDAGVANNLLSEAEEILTEARNVTAKALVKDHVGQAREMFTELRGLGYELEEENRLFADVRGAVSGQDFIEACRLLLEVKESLGAIRVQHYSGKASEAVREFADLLAEAEGLGLDVSGEKELLPDLENALAGGLSDEVLKAAGEASGKLRSAIAEIRAGSLSEERSELEPVLEAARSMGLEITEDEEALANIEAMAGEGRYGEAMEAMMALRGSLEQKIDKHYVSSNHEKIEMIRGQLAELEEVTGGEEWKLRESVERAAGALEDMRLGDVDSALEEFSRLLAERRETHRSQVLQEQLAGLTAELDSMVEAELDTGEAASMALSCREALDAGELPALEESLERLSEIMETLRTVDAKTMAKESFIAVKDLVGKAKELALLTPEAEAGFRQAVERIRGREFLEGIKLLGGVNAVLAEILNTYHKGEAERLLAEATVLMEEVRDADAGIELFTGALDALRERFSGGRFQEVHAGLEETVLEMREAVDRSREGALAARLEAVIASMGEARDRGIDISQEVESLAELEALKEERRYGDAMEIVSSVEGVLEERMAENLRVLKEKKLGEARAALGEIEGLGGREYGDLRIMLDDMFRQFEEGDYANMDETVAAFYYKKEEYSSELLAGTYSPRLQEYASVLADYGGMGLDTGMGDQLLAEAWKAVEGQSFDRMPGITGQLDGFLEETRSVGAKELAKTHLTESKSLLLRVREAGMEPGADNEIFGDVLENVRSRDFLGALRSSRSIRSRLEKMLADRTREEAERLVRETGNMVVEAGELGLDAGEADGKVREAASKLESDDPEGALGPAREAHEALTGILGTYYSGRAGKALADAAPLLDRMRAEDLVSAAWEEGFGEVRQDLEAGNCKEAAILAEETLVSLTNGERQHFSRKAEGLLETARSTMERCAEKGVDVNFAAELLESARENLASGDYDDVIRTATELKRELEGAEVQYLKKDTSAMFSEIWKMTSEASELELDISGVEEMVARAQEYLRDGELDRGSDLAASAREEIKEALDGRYGELLEGEFGECGAEVARADELGTDIAREKELIASARGAWEAGQYGDALKVIRGAREAIRTGVENMHRSRTEAGIRERMEALRGLEERSGAAPQELVRIMERCGEAMKVGDTEEVASLLAAFDREAEGAAAAREVADIEEAFSSMAGEMEEFDALSLDVSGAREILARGLAHAGIGELEQSLTVREELSAAMEHIRSEGAKELAKVRITEIKKLFGEVRSAGVDTSSEEETFKELVGAVKKGDFIEALGLCHRAELSLEQKRTARSAEELWGRISEVEAMISVGAEMGLDTGGAMTELGAAKELYGSGDLAASGERAASALVIFETARKEHRKGEARVLMEELQGLIMEAMDADVDMVALDDMAANARMHYDKGDFDRSKEYSQAAREQIREAMRGAEARVAETELEGLRGLVARAGELGVDVTAHDEALTSLAGLLAEERYQEVRAGINEIREEVHGPMVERGTAAYGKRWDSLAGLIAEARRLGMEPQAAEAEARKAEGLAAAEDYSGAIELADETGQRLKGEIDEFRKAHESMVLRKAAVAIESLEAETSGIPGLEYDLSDMRERLEAARQAADSGDDVMMREAIRELHEMEKRRTASLVTEAYPMVLDAISGDMEKIQGIGIPLALAEELMGSAREQLAAGDLDRVRDLRKQLEEIIGDARGEPAKGIAKKHIGRVRKALKELKEQGVDMTQEEGRFREVLAAVKKEDFVEATCIMVEIIDMLRVKRVDHYTGRINEKLLKVDETVRKASRKNLDVKATRRRAFEARALLKRRKYARADQLAGEALEMAQDVWEASLREGAATALAEVESLVAEAKDYYDVAEVEAMVAEAREEFGQGGFISSMEHIEEAKRLLSDIKSGKVETAARAAVGRMEKLAAMLSDAGMDAAGIEVPLGPFRDRFESGEMEGLAEEIINLEREFLSARRREYAEFLEEIGAVSHVTDESKEELRDKAASLENLLGSEEWGSAEALAVELSSIAEATRARIKLEEEYLSLTSQARELIERARENDIDVGAEESKLEEAGSLKESEKLEEAISALMELHKALVKAVGELLRDRAEALLSETAEFLNEEAESMDVEALMERLEGARERFEAGDYEASMDGCGEIKELLTVMHAESDARDVEELMTKARKELEKNKDIGIDIFELEAYIFKASMAFQSGDLAATAELARRAIDAAVTGREGIDEGKIRMTLRNTESLIFESSEYSVDMGEIEEKLEEAEKLLDERKLQDAKDLTERLYESAQSLIDETLGAMIPERFQEISDLIERAKEAGTNVEEDEVALISIDTLREEGRLLSAIKMIESVRTVVSEKLGERRDELAKSRLNKAFEDFNLVRETAIADIPELEEILDRALAASTGGELETVNELVDEFYSRKDEHERKVRAGDLAEAVENLAARLAPLGELDIDVTTGWDLLESARGQLAVEDYDAADGSCSEIRELIDNIYLEKLQPDSEANIKQIDVMMDRLREKGVDVAAEESMFSEVLTAMDGGDYARAYDVSSRLRMVVSKIYDHRRKEMLDARLEEAERFFSDFEEKGYFEEPYRGIIRASIDELREHFDGGEMDLCEEKFGILDETIETLRTKLGIKLEVDELLSEARGFLETGENLGVETAKEAETVKKAEAHFLDGEYDEAKPLLESALKPLKKRINKRRMSIAKMVLEDALETFNERRSKVDIEVAEEAQELLKDATRSFKKGRFEAAIKIAKELKAKMTGAQEAAPPDLSDAFEGEEEVEEEEEPEAPPEEPEPEPEPEPEKAPVEKPPEKEKIPPTGKRVKLSCPTCKKAYAARIAKVPAVAMCPYCGTKAVIKNI